MVGVMNLLPNVEASGTRKFRKEVDPEDLHRPYGLCLLLAFLRLVEGSASIIWPSPKINSMLTVNLLRSVDVGNGSTRFFNGFQGHIESLIQLGVGKKFRGKRLGLFVTLDIRFVRLSCGLEIFLTKTFYDPLKREQTTCVCLK